MQVDTLLTIGSCVGTIVISVATATATLTWWLGRQFSDTRKSFYLALQQHEQLDQQRHEQHLASFASLRIALARSGIDGEA